MQAESQQEREDQLAKTIQTEIRQNQRINKLEIEDRMRRDCLQQTIDDKQKKVGLLRKLKLQNRIDSAQTFNKFADNKLKIHQTTEELKNKTAHKRFRQVTQQMQRFHDQSLQKLRKEWRRLQKLKTCSNDAHIYISIREAQNILFSQQAKQHVELCRQYTQPNPQSMQSIWLHNQKIDNALSKADILNSTKESIRINKYCEQLDKMNRMHLKKKMEANLKIQKNRQIRKFSVDRVKSNRKLALSPRTNQKCQSRLISTTRNSIRIATASTFSVGCRYRTITNHQNKKTLKEMQEERNQRIMDKHLTISRRNTEIERLGSDMEQLRMATSLRLKHQI